MPILESDLALGLTRKIMHNYLMNNMTKFENFWTSDSYAMIILVHCPESIYQLERQFLLSHPLIF